MAKNFLMLMIAIIFLLPNLANAEEIIIFHTNDMHGRISSTDDKGKSIGLAEMSAAFKFSKSQNKNTFWFDAGDTFNGTIRINISNGENLVPLLNQSGMDIFVPGNHDFNYSPEQLVNLSKKLKFSTLAANVVKKDSGETILNQYKIFKRGNLKIGVFGLATPETVYKAVPSFFKNIVFLNPVDTAKEMVKILRPQCDIVIAVMHMGIDPASEFTSKRIAAETEGIDLIIDGHSHTELPQGLTVGETLIAQTGCYEHYFGRVTINFEDGKIISKKAELLDVAAVKKISPNPNKKILNSIKKIDAKNEKFFGEVIAHSDRKLDGERLTVRCGESEIGNLCADAFRWKTGADIAVINGGSIRSGLPTGDLTRGQILEIFPFSNQIKIAEINGKTVRQMLEHSVRVYPNNELGGFLSVSGISFTVDAKKPAGQRVQDIFIGGQLLDENKIYTIATSNFLFEGGDAYSMLKNITAKGGYGSDNSILAEYINKFGTAGIELGRIKFL